MSSNNNHIFDKQTRTWFDVTPEQFQEFDRWRTRLRKRNQAHGDCVCPRGKWWLCDGICPDCEFHASGSTISLDAPIVNNAGDDVSLREILMDPNSLFDSILCDKAEMDMLFARLDELMPEAKKIGLLRLQGMTDEAIARTIGIKRTTFLSRLKKVRGQLSAEYPHCF